ncbi:MULTISPECIES: tripartite tricarboxylate transporter substrate binding protein [unclassified Rhodopseudomonas]|uniref:Bug family tripartite tricarboxylate transporter substrate binding protein n=1 Tax=unclassified Rhodopseudomonas TaxID=2638247 RepID=UPI0013DF2230|nr:MULTISPECIES: tripartite tricarboxylate transporter substrate binding protein [unclassified Rhodopseudomonas]NEV78511.1 tripartite tricarboxylate transporter substrate binding protein [Rhodopseudomonas sp. BR0C11]NEW98037.1 tripartite tricarboxylate transporter substrate binding protein [Rhodopseudomonas sp. BR0G17]
MTASTVSRRILLCATFAASLVAALPASAQPADWPNKPLKLIVPFPPGGAADAVGRVVAEKLSEVLKQPVVVENKAGAGTAIAADAAAKAAPDGYTLSLAPAGQLTILPHLNKSLSYDPFKSFAPVSLVAEVPYVIGASADTPATSLKDLIAAAKKEPGKLSYSSCGNGTLCHLSGELFKNLTGTDLLHVPFKGSAPAIQALLGGQVNLSFDTLTILAPQVKSGKVKGLVITSRTRSPLLPDVPTAAEAGLPEFVVSSWFGIVVPAGTPKDIVARLNTEINALAKLPDVRDRLAAQGLDAIPSTPEAFTKVIHEDYARWGKVVEASGAKLD